MNIFVIPSWYPTTDNPIAGIFVKEQSMAVACLRDDINIVVAKWDDGRTYLPLKKPVLTLKITASYFHQKPFVHSVRKNYYEINTPCLTWSTRLPFGGADRLIKPIEAALLSAINTVGKIDVIHAHVSYPAGYIAFKLSKKLGIPYIITEHMGPFPFTNYLKNGKPMPEIQDAFCHAKRTIAVSRALCQRITSFELPCSDIVPNVVNENVFNIGNQKNKLFTFLTLCSLSPQKGIDILLSAIARLSILPNVQFVIAGEGAQLEFYQQYATELGIAEKIVWLGRVDRDKAPSLFQQSHAYVMASRHETFGVVYAEAIACGLPIIATKCGGPEDIVTRDNGLLVPVDDVEQLANAMEHIYHHYTEFDPYKIREDFLNKFSKKAVVEQIVTIYEDVKEKH